MAAAASGGRKPSQRSCSRSAFDALFYSGAMCEEDEEDTVVRNDAPNGVDGSAAPSKAEEDAFDDDNDCPYGFDDDFLCKSIGKSSPNDAAVTGSSATTTITTKLCPAPSFLSPLWQRKQSQQKPPQSGERSFRSTRNSHSFSARQSSMRRRKQQQQSKEAKGEEDDGMSTSVYGMDMLRGSSLRRSRSNRRGSSPHAAATTTAVSGGAATASAASTASAALTSRASASQQPQPPADPPTSPLSSPFRAALIAHSTNVAAAPVAAAAGGYEANEATTGGVFLADGAQETPYTRDWVVEVKATAGGGTTVPAHPTARSPSRLALPIDILTAVGVAKESERADGAAAASAAAGEADERQTAGNGAARGAPIEFVPWFPSSPLPPNGLSGSTGAPVPPPGAYMSPQRSSFFKRRRSMPRLMAGGNSNNNTNAAAAAAAAAVAGTAVGTNAAVDGTPGSSTPVLAYSLSSRMTSLFSMSSFCAIAE